MKRCSKCKTLQDESNFSKHTKNKDGLRCECKTCNKLEKASNPEQKLQYEQQYRELHKTELQQYNKEYREQHLKKIQQQNQQYYEDNKDKIALKNKQQYIANRDIYAERNKQYYRRRLKNDSLFKLTAQIRTRINNDLKRFLYSKNSSTSELLGCTFEEFFKYLGPKPEGKYDKDHICPCAQAQNEEELIKLQHYTNFRWLNKKENLKKSDNWTPEAEQKCRELLGRDWIFV